MTTNVTTGPAIAAYTSTRFTASVNAQPAWVAAQTHDMTVASPHWTQGDPVELSWVKFNGNDATATVSITRIAGAITSAVVYPKNVATQVIVAGILILTVPNNTRLHVEVNGDRANAILVFSQPTARAIPAGSLDFDDVCVKPVAISGSTFTSAAHGMPDGTRVGFRSTGTYPTSGSGDLAPHTHYFVVNSATNTFQLARTAGGAAISLTGTGSGTRTVYLTRWTNTTNALAFPLGEWHIGRLFELADNVKIVLQPEAVVIGGFDLRGRNGVSIFGEGLLLGSFATHDDLFDLGLFPNFASQLPYCMFLGHGDTGQVFWDNEVQGVTISSLPFFCNFEGVSEWTNVQCINPWFYGTLTPQVSPQSEILPAGQMTYCYSYSGDDVLTLGEQAAGFYTVVQGCFLATANNSCLHFGYWSTPDAGTYCFVNQCDMLHLGLEDNGPGSTTFPSYGGTSVMKCWTDGYEGEEQYGRFDVFVQDCRVWGEHDGRLLHVGNFPYPFTHFGPENRARKGQAARFTITNLTVEHVPGQISVIEGLDWLNTPHDFAFRGVSIGGTKMDAGNFATFVSWNAYPYFLTVEGKTVTTPVDLCNRAVGLIGEGGFLTSISPPDDTKVAKLCTKYFASCFEAVTQGHEWSWATKRAALTLVPNAGNDTYRYCYEIPAGMLQLLELMPKGAPDGYLDPTGRKVLGRVEVGTQTVQRIWTNLADAWARFTVYVTNVNLLDPHAQEALVMKLAAKLVGAIVQGKEGQAAMLQYEQLAQFAIAKARAIDGNQRVLTPVQKVTWLEGREG